MNHFLKKFIKDIPFFLYYFFILVLVIVLGTISYTYIKNRFIHQKRVEISSIAELKVQQISDFREHMYRDAQLFFDNQSFIQIVKKNIEYNDPASRGELNNWLRPIIKDRFYSRIIITDAQTRKNIFDIPSGKLQSKPRSDSLFLKCLRSKDIIFGNLLLDPADSTIFLNICVPLILKTKSSTEKTAILELVINPYTRFYDLLQSLPNAGNTGEVLLVRRDGNNVLYLNDLRFIKKAALRFKLPLENKNLPAARAIYGDEAVSEGIDYRGKEVLAIAKLIPETQWSVIVKYDLKEIYKDLHTIGTLIFIVSLILLITSLFGLTIIRAQKKLVDYESRLKDLKTIKRLSHVYRLLIGIEQAITKNNDRDKLLQEVCQTIANDKNYIWCWIGLINSKSGLMEPFIECGIDFEFQGNLSYKIAENLNECLEPTIQTINSGGIFLSNDIWNDPKIPVWCEKVLPTQLKSMAVFPLTQNSKTIGAIFFYSDQIEFFIEEEISLLERLCSDLSYGFDKIELEIKERIARENLEKNELILLEKEIDLTRQNEKLIALNEKYLSTNEELMKLNDRLESVNQKLEIARKKAEESNHLKSAFLANMSHEIRTPMNAIIGFAGLLEQNTNSTSRKEYCRIIMERSHDLLTLINDILDISKIESNTVTLFNEWFSLGKFLDELFLIYNNKLKQLNKKEIRLICTKPNNANQFMITTDTLKFRQIFTNLLDNALKFTETGEINFGYSNHNGSHLECFVSDTGIGIDPKDQTIIFEMFQQANTKLQKAFGGTGLGLAISKGNAILMGGDIYVESSLGKGSKFYFTILHNNEVNKEENIKRKGKFLNNLWATKKMLIVEDDIYSIALLKHLLSPTGILLHIARSGKEMEEYYNKLQDMDIVILDLRLPDANGVNIMKQIKALRKELPVIAQTAFAMEDDRQNCMEAGFNDYVAKPIKHEEFLDLISYFID